MRVAEIYQSKQGEGFLTGRDSVFLRASGCNLRCCYCDTPQTSWSPVGSDLDVDEIVAQVRKYGVDHVVVTGGEPMLFAELIPICDRLKAADLHITIETAGTLYLPVRCDLMSISPKMQNSVPSIETEFKWHQRHNRVRYAPQVIDRLTREYDYQFKFVVATEDDLPEIDEFLAKHPNIKAHCVMMMPEGTQLDRLHEVGAWLQPICEQKGLVFCPRKHIEWFGFVPGT